MYSVQIIFTYLLSAVLIDSTTTTDLMHDETRPVIRGNINSLGNVFVSSFQHYRGKRSRNIPEPQNIEFGNNNYVHRPLLLHPVHSKVNHQQIRKSAPHHGRYWYHNNYPPPPPPPPPTPAPTTTTPAPEPIPCQLNFACLQAASAIANAQAISQGGHADASALAVSQGNAQATAHAQSFSGVGAYNSITWKPRNSVLSPTNSDFVFPDN